MLKKLVVAGAAASALVGAAWVLPAAAGKGQATLTVTKTVEGVAPADAEFVINVFCTDGIPVDTVPELEPLGLDGIVYDEDITFGPEGGSEDFDFFDFATCTITEVDDGGADSSSGPVEVDISGPELFDAEIVNTFDAEAATTVAPTPTTAAAAAGAVRAAPTFTG